MTDIKETKDLAYAAAATKRYYETYLRDGFQAQDLAGLLALYSPFEQAVVGITNVPNELKDLDDAEITELTDIVGEDMLKNPDWQDIFFGALKIWKGITGLRKQPEAV